jgi:endonuclease III
MQIALDLGQENAFGTVRNRLRRLYGSIQNDYRLDPVSQLVKSMLSSRTYDAVSWHAYEQLTMRYRGWSALAQASPAQIEPLIAAVQFADRKAVEIPAVLRRLRAISGALSLEFLRDWGVGESLRYLESFDGIGRKVAAAVVNFSTLRKPALVLDTHVLRVLARFGLISPGTRQAGPAYDAIMPVLAGWSAAELYEFHWLIKKLGQDVCADRAPRCRACPLETLCLKQGLR